MNKIEKMRVRDIILKLSRNEIIDPVTAYSFSVGNHDEEKTKYFFDLMDNLTNQMISFNNKNENKD